MLAKLHEGHQGIVKYKSHAAQSVWWPGFSQQVNEMVLKYRMCLQEHYNHTEAFTASDYPERPWQKLGTNLFELGEKHIYLLLNTAQGM